MTNVFVNIAAMITSYYLAYTFLHHGDISKIMRISFLVLIGILNIMWAIRAYRSFKGVQLKRLETIGNSRYFQIVMLGLYVFLLYVVFSIGSFDGTWGTAGKIIAVVGGIYISFLIFRHWVYSSNQS